MFKSNFLIVFVVLIILWALDLFVLHMIGGLIHVLLVVAVVPLIVHFLRGRPEGSDAVPMSFACKSERRCDHSLKECSAVRGEYCLVCHHNSSLATPARRSTPLGPRKDRTRLAPG